MAMTARESISEEGGVACGTRSSFRNFFYRGGCLAHKGGQNL